MEIIVARSFRTRLVGLALRRRPPCGSALLIPRCSSIHTFGMRFPLDLVWLAADGRVLAIHRSVPPRRVASHPGAGGVIEVPAGQGEMIVAVANQQLGRLTAALDPRQPIYRDTYNEYFVLLLSAGGAAAGTQVPLYIVMAITGLWPIGIFVAACVVFELVVIFGVARPQMKPAERLGWVALWSAATAVMAVLFYELVASPTL